MTKAIAQRWQGTTTADPRLAGLRAGDAALVEEVLHELLPSVRGWLYRRLGPDAAVDDATQEALTEIARALPDYQGRSSLSVYAYRITARVAARQLRGRIQRREHFAAAVPEDHASLADALNPERDAIQRQALRRVLRCLERLPARRREAFILCEIEGMSPQQAAEHVGSSAQAIRSRLMHARRELKRRLGESAAVLGYRGAP